MTPLLIIVGADKGGTGKTTVTRALLDYLEKHKVPARIVDTESPKGALKRFYPAAEVIDLSETIGKMSVFDGLAAASVTVVDIRAGLLSSTLKALLDTGLLADVKAGRVQLVVLHILGPTIASLSEVGSTATTLLDGGLHFLVKNCANDEKFEWQPGTHDAYFIAINPTGMLEFQHLDGVAREDVENSAQTFTAFGADEKHSRTLRGYVRKWLGEAFNEFDRVGIGELAAAAPKHTRHGYPGE
jgi:hypothetical protein